MARMLRGFLVLLLICTSALAELRTFSSRFYQVHTDLEPGLALDLARRLDAMHDYYTHSLGAFDIKQNIPPADAYLFTAQADYLAFVGGNMRNTGGVYIPSRNALAAFHDGQGRDSLRRTLQHEAFHQFAASAIRYPLPMWLNEGLAQYFEEGLWTGNGFTLGHLPPTRVKQLQSDLAAGRLMDFQKFMSISADDWAAGLKTRYVTRGATQYNQAWAMVHFLVNDSDPGGQPRFRARLVQMVQMIHEGNDAEQAFALAFGGNYKTFHDRFCDWAKTLQPSTEATYIEHQNILADMLIALNGYGKRVGDIRQFRSAVEDAQLEIQYSKGFAKWSTGHDPSVYFTRMDHTEYAPDELRLEPRRTAPLPDIVSRCLPNTLLRTRFYKVGDKIEHELLFEPLNAPPAMASPLRR